MGPGLITGLAARSVITRPWKPTASTTSPTRPLRFGPGATVSTGATRITWERWGGKDQDGQSSARMWHRSYSSMRSQTGGVGRRTSAQGLYRGVGQYAWAFVSWSGGR